MGKVNNYRVWDHRTGDFLCEGTARECSTFFEITEQAFHQRVERALHNGDHRCWDVEVDKAKKAQLFGADKTVAEEWEAFMEPLRKKFGIKVKRMDNVK